MKISASSILLRKDVIEFSLRILSLSLFSPPLSLPLFERLDCYFHLRNVVAISKERKKEGDCDGKVIDNSINEFQVNGQSGDKKKEEIRE